MLETILSEDLRTATGGRDNPKPRNWRQHNVPIRKRPSVPVTPRPVDDDLCDGFCGPQD